MELTEDHFQKIVLLLSHCCPVKLKTLGNHHRIDFLLTSVLFCSVFLKARPVSVKVSSYFTSKLLVIFLLFSSAMAVVISAALDRRFWEMSQRGDSGTNLRNASISETAEGLTFTVSKLEFPKNKH